MADEGEACEGGGLAMIMVCFGLWTPHDVTLLVLNGMFTGITRWGVTPTGNHTGQTSQRIFTNGPPILLRTERLRMKSFLYNNMREEITMTRNDDGPKVVAR